MSVNEELAVVADEASTKNGEENFKEEIKDYAKTTMNELLGMFGYDDEMTSESVDSLEIKVPSSSEEPCNTCISGTTAAHASTAYSIATVTAQTSTATVIPLIVTPSLPLTVPEDPMDDTPVIVKVEGNTSVSDIIRQQNGGSNITSNYTGTTTTVSRQVTQTLATAPAVTTQASLAISVPTTSQSATKQPALIYQVKRPITGITIPIATTTPNTLPVVRKPASKSLSPYLSSTIQSQVNRPCTWCKTSTVLKNFTFRDGTRILECRNICSQECFELAALSIELNNENIRSIQRRIIQLRETKASPSKSTVGAASGTTSARPAKKDKRALPLLKPLFNWEKYLRESRTKGAPLSYFKQSSTPPHNGFKPGMKLEVADPRVVKSTCIATVVGSIGPRVRFQFDGTDKSNDIWHMVDSTEIHPVGWCEANGGQLQPPVGFINDPGRYQKFVATTLATAGSERIAPARVFKKPPGTPDKNMFAPGMKLEAADPKNQVLVCVATVGEVDGDRVRIDFDGYMGSDYWCRYDSRNIFPIGWCTLNGHTLQPPGTKKRANMANMNRAKTKEDEPLTKKQRLTSPTIKALSSSSPSNTTQSVSSPANSSDDPAHSRAQPSVVLYVNHGCRVGRHMDKDKIGKLRGPWIGNNNVNIVLQSCIQDLVNCAHNQKKVFGFLKPGHGKAKITAHCGSETLSCNLQFVDRLRLFWKVMDKFLEKLQCCDNLISTTKIKVRCDKCHGKAVPRGSLPVKRATPSIQTDVPNTRQLDNQDVSSPQVCSTSPAKTWSVDEVIKYIEGTELSDHVPLFRRHEIDGRALLLLNRDMIMSYMGLKLGPAIKLLNIVDDLKPQEIVEVE